MTPSPTPLTILVGTHETIPSNLIDAHIRFARHDLMSSRRLMIVDRGGLADRHIDKRIDLMIDPKRGNWDICTDSAQDDDAFAIVASMLGRAGPPRQRKLATKLLMNSIRTVSSCEGTGLDPLRHACCAFDQEQVAASILDCDRADDTTSDIWPVLAILHAAGAYLRPHDRQLAPTSINRWYAEPAGRILFVQDPEDDGAIVDVLGAILELAERRASGYQAVLDYGRAVLETEFAA